MSTEYSCHLANDSILTSLRFDVKVHYSWTILVKNGEIFGARVGGDCVEISPIT